MFRDPILYLILLGVSLCSVGNTQEYSYVQFTMEDGLPTNYVYGAVEDDRGYMWFYTENGLVKFDAYSMEVINTSNGLPINDIYYLHKDVDGNLLANCIDCPLFMINQDSILILEEKLIRRHFHLDKQNRWMYKLFSKDGNNDPEFLTIGNNCFYDVETNTIYNWENKKFVAHKKLGEGEGIEATWREYYSVFENIIVEQIKDNEIKISRIDNDKSIQFSLLDYYQKEPSLVQMEYYNQTIKITSEFGLIEVDKQMEIVDVFDTPANVKNKGSQINRIYKDLKGNFWIGTTDQGLYYFFNQKTDRFHFEMNKSVLSVAFLNDDLFLASSDEEVFRITEQGEVTKVFDKENNRKEIQMLSSFNSNLFLQFDGRNYEWNAQKNAFDHMIGNRDDFNAILHLRKFYYHSNLKAYIAYYKEQVKIRKIGSTQILFKSDQSFQDYAIDNMERHFYLSGDGIYMLLEENLSLEKILDYKFAGYNQFEIYHDQFIIASQDGRLFQLNEQGQKIMIDEYERINFLKLIADELWLGTSQGLIKYEFDADQVAKKKSQYTTANGLSSNIINDIAFKDGYIYLATSKGLNRIPETQNETQETIPITLEFSINDKPLMEYETSVFKHNENDLIIYPRMFSYESLGQEHYKYKLNDNEWISFKPGPLKLDNLSPRKYNIQIQGFDAFEAQTEIKQRNFRVQNYFMSYVWFFISGFVLLAAMVYLFSRWRLNTLLNEEKKQSEIQRQMDALQLESLQSRMNPHFIFNALNSIQYYIQFNNKKLASKYLVKFSKLMRLSLEASKKESINLKQEIELLGIYLELEQLRFEGLFNYSIEIDPEIDIDKEQVPPMLLQPLLENAIKHGVAFRKSDGIILLRIEKDQEGLKVIVKDNGIGIERSKEKVNRLENHKSRGTELIIDRIALIKNIMGKKVSIDYKSANEHHEFPGTIVTLILPKFKQAI